MYIHILAAIGDLGRCKQQSPLLQISTNMKQLFCTVLTFILMFPVFTQQSKLWSEDNRKYLIENLSRTKDSIVAETKNLSQAQWNFKESSGRWSINQIVEHLAIWETLLQREISQAFVAGPRPELNKEARTDSAVVGFLMEENPHIATEYTKPFTFTVPMGLNDGKIILHGF